MKALTLTMRAAYTKRRRGFKRIAQNVEWIMRLSWMIVCSAGLAAAASLPQRGQPPAVVQAPPPAPARPQLLHPIFDEHAVLQRDRPISVYGETTAGAAVTISIGSVSARAVAGADGRWRAVLPPMAAGGPYTLTASADRETL